MKIVINENEKSQISSKHEEFDSNILFFLMRRIKIQERELSSFGLNDEEIERIKSEIEELEKEGNEKNLGKIEELKRELKILLPLKITEYTFENFPGYGFNSYATKKEMTNSILNLLVEKTKLIDDEFFELPSQDPKKQKVIKTIRKFLNNILKK